MKLSTSDIENITRLISKNELFIGDFFNYEGLSYIDKNIQDVFVKTYYPLEKITYHNNCVYLPIKKQEDVQFVLRFMSMNEEDIATNDNYFTLCKQIIEEYLSVIGRRSLSVNVLNDLLLELIFNDVSHYQERFIAKANLCSFNYKIPRRIVLLDTIGLNQIISDVAYEDKIQEILDSIMKELRKYFSNYNDCTFYLNDDKFIILKTLDDALEETLTNFSIIVEKTTGVKSQFIVSDICYELKDYNAEYKKILEVHKLFQPRLIARKVYFVEEFEIELLMSNLVENNINHKSVIRNNLEKLYETDKVLIETLKQFFKNNMDNNETAKKMFVHKNTVYYRMKKLSEELNINVFLPYNCAKVFLCCCLLEKNRHTNILDVTRGKSMDIIKLNSFLKDIDMIFLR
jgi:sugar diacid utilization regulator